MTHWNVDALPNSISNENSVPHLHSLHHSNDENSVPHTLKCVFNKFQLCTSNLKVPHMNQIMYICTWDTQSFKDKAILTLGNQDFELGCIIQYRWNILSVTHWIEAYVQQISALYILLNILNQTIYIATWDREI